MSPFVISHQLSLTTHNTLDCKSLPLTDHRITGRRLFACNRHRAEVRVILPLERLPVPVRAAVGANKTPAMRHPAAAAIDTNRLDQYFRHDLPITGLLEDAGIFVPLNL